MFAAKAVPLAFRQLRQLQKVITPAWASASNTTAPHKQLPLSTLPLLRDIQVALITIASTSIRTTTALPSRMVAAQCRSPGRPGCAAVCLDAFDLLQVTDEDLRGL